MQIRRYKQEDTHQILELFTNTVQQVNIKDYTKEQVNAWAPKGLNQGQWESRIKHLATSLSSKATYVAESEGKIVGFANLENNGHIDHFYCHKDFQRQGIGTLLYETIESQAKCLNLEKLFTEASITAKPFFESKGFVVIEKQEVVRSDVTFVNFKMHKYR